MKAQTTSCKSKTQFSLFLFFLSGLFLLQIAFAFTIHGDIGPNLQVVPGIEKPAPAILVGRIDSLVGESRLTTPVKVAPEGAFAPATRDFGETDALKASIVTESSIKTDITEVSSLEGDRFVEYRIKSGDTLERISRKLFGSTSMVQPLIRLNRISDEKALRLGATIKAPKAGLLASVNIN